MVFICKGILACLRYVIGFVLLLGAATTLNVAIVVGWNYLSPDSFNRSVAAAVNSVGPGSKVSVEEDSAQARM